MFGRKRKFGHKYFKHTKDHGSFPKEQYLFKFDSGYGASVVRGYGTYGSESGLWELALIKWVGKKFKLVYQDDGPFTDVCGHLDEKSVQAHIDQIKALKD